LNRKTDVEVIVSVAILGQRVQTDCHPKISQDQMPHAAACQSLERRVSALLQFLLFFAPGHHRQKSLPGAWSLSLNGGESPCTVADYWGTDRENKETGRIRQAQGNVATLSGGAELAKVTATDRATKAVAIEKHWPGP
jgi:hypothetical protein